MTDGVDDLVWMRLEEPSAAGAARRYVSDLSRRLEFDEQRTAEVAIATTELATNAVVHAVEGALLVRVRRQAARPSIEVLVMDAGPGMSSVAASSEDGRSTRGTLGIGLGSVRRLATRLQISSVLDRGTVVWAEFRAEHPPPGPLHDRRWDGLTRPMTGEVVCGDSWAARDEGDRVSVMLADGLGHGELAARASRAAVDSFVSGPLRGPSEALAAAHRQMTGTRGAAVMVVESSPDRSVRFAGMGNVVARVVGFERTTTLSSQPGIVGQHAKQVREQRVEHEPQALIVVHSDGLTAKWDQSLLHGYGMHQPTVAAAVLLRDAGLRQDDASVVAVRTV
jgi:anti-sigma regulatory factor (Ser/Thr protein kinase)